MRWPRRARHGALIAALLLGALAAVGPALERSRLALQVLIDLQAGTPRRDDSTSRQAADFVIDGRHHQADRYAPTARPAKATLVLLHGFTPDGRREPRLARLAEILAGAGLSVLVPELPGIRSLQVSAGDARDIGDALRHALEQRPDACHPVGELAVSFAVGPALLAALDPQLRERVAFVVAVGGYYDLSAAITYATTGFDPLSGRYSTPPAPEGRWWLLRSEATQLADPVVRDALAELAQRRLADPDAAVDDLLPQLGPAGRALYQLAANTDPQRTAPLIAALPDGIRQQLDKLDLSQRDLGTLHARLLLLHGTGDTVIPVSHSRALRDRIGAHRARLFEADGLQHVDVAPGLLDAWQLWRAVHALLALADQTPPGC